MPTSTTDLGAIARLFYEPLSTGDTSVLDQALAPDWEAVPAMRSPDVEGWKAGVEHLRGIFSDLRTTIEDVIVDGDRVAIRSTTRGVHDGELLGVAATGKEIEVRACDVHRFVDARIVETWHLEDYFGVAGQLGLKFSL